MPRIPGSPRVGLQAPAGTYTNRIQSGVPIKTNHPSGAVWRHQFSQAATYPGAGVLITQQVYAILELAKFERSFGGTLDSGPTPIANTNNFASTKVYNNSRIQNYNANIILKNESGGTTPVYLDMYLIAYSFEEALVHDTIWTASCPVSMNITLGGGNAGEVTTKTPIIGLIDRQTIQDSNFVKRFVMPMGTIVVPPENAGGVAEVNINTLPPKCRRANSGMYCAIAFANDALKNNGDKSVRIVGQYDFEEIPSATRNAQFPG